MQVSHGATCVHGCLGSSTAHPGSIVRFSCTNIHDLTLPTKGDELAVILRSSDGYSGVARGQELYHCVPITRAPLTSLGTSYRIRHVHERDVAYFEASCPFDLLVVQEPPKGIFLPLAQFNFDYRDCVQPASVRRIPRRCLHQLPGNVTLSMVEPSLNAVLRQVDGIGCAMGDPAMGLMLPETLNDQRRREDLMTLNLLRVVDRIRQPGIVIQPPPGMDRRRKSRKVSVWDQGKVPRNGGRG